MDQRLHGVLLALSGDDADLLRAIDTRGSGLRVVRRCADTAELLSAAMAGLATLVVADTEFDELDRSVLDRLEHAGVTGIILAPAEQVERWATVGWPVEDRRTRPDAVRARLQALAHALEAGRGERAEPPESLRTAPVPDTGADDRLWTELEDVILQTPATPERVDETADPDAPIPNTPLWARTPPTPDPDRGFGTPSTGPGGRLAVVWGPRGSSGRTTIATALAHTLATAGGAILVDADVEAPCLTQVLGLPEDSSGLATAARLAGHGRLDDEALESLLVPFGELERLLSGLGRPGRWRELPPAAMAEVWARCRRLAAWTVIDVAGGPIDDSVDEYTLEPGRGAVAADLVRNADVVLVVSGADPVGVRRLLQLLGDFEDEARPTGRIEVVVTRVRSGIAGPSPRRAVRDALDRYGSLDEVTLVPDDPATADRCLMEGRAVTEAAPGSALGRALTELAHRVDPTVAPKASGAKRRRGLRRSRRAAASRPRHRPARPGGAQRTSARLRTTSVPLPAFPPETEQTPAPAPAPPPPPPERPASSRPQPPSRMRSGPAGTGGPVTRMERRRRGRAE